MRRPPPLLLLTLVAACGRAPVPDKPAVPAVDPAIAEAVNTPLLTDPQMTAAARDDALLPGEVAPSRAVPLDTVIDIGDAPPLAARIAAARATPAFARCTGEVGYAARFTVDLPAPLALTGDARAIDAGGVDSPDCRLRAVRYATAAAPAVVQRAIAARARAGSITVQLPGERAAPGAVVALTTTRAGDWTIVDLVTNRGG